ncbi:MAG: hypothetical protein P1U89_04055 [Verrucomicrobiales bacterium]|nr:hypothetical protein [Verrucomicrobiales bacterium]
MDLELEEITEEALKMKEIELNGIIGPIPPPPPSQERIDRIMNAVMKDSADFVVEGMGRGLKGVLDTMIALKKKDDDGPKRSY